MNAAQVYGALLSAPGMAETVKIDLKLSRKTVLLLHKAVERGLAGFDGSSKANILSTADKESLSELETVITECLGKAGLTELNEKLRALEIS